MPGAAAAERSMGHGPPAMRGSGNRPGSGSRLGGANGSGHGGGNWAAVRHERRRIGVGSCGRTAARRRRLGQSASRRSLGGRS